MTITIEDQIENNKLYATEIKNAVLNKLPRNLDITKMTLEAEDGISVRVQFDISLDGKECGDYRFYANLYNDNYPFQTVVDVAASCISDFANPYL